jgi:hypothetical protein
VIVTKVGAVRGKEGSWLPALGFILVRGGVSGLIFIAAASVLAMFVVSSFGPRTLGLSSEAVRNRRMQELRSP